MKKLFLSLFVIFSMYVVGNELANQSSQNSLEKTEHYFSSGDYIQECPYEGYTWQEVEAVVDKIVAFQRESQCQKYVERVLNSKGEPGRYENWQVALAFPLLTQKEWRLLIIASEACHKLVNEDTPEQELSKNAQMWMNQGIVCALIEIAAGQSLGLLTQEAEQVSRAYHDRYVLRWLPLLIANGNGINVWDYEKVENLTAEQAKLVYFPKKLAELYKSACILGPNKELENSWYHIWYDLTDVRFAVFENNNEEVLVSQIKFS